jgi:hypothetical protein
MAGIALLAVFSWALLSRPTPRPKEEMQAVNRAPAPLAQASPAEATSEAQPTVVLKKADGPEKSKELLAQNDLAPKERRLDDQLQENLPMAKDGGAPSKILQDQAVAAAASGTPVQLAKTEPSSTPNLVQYGFFAASQTPSAPPTAESLSRRASSALATSASKQPAQNGILVSFRVEQTGQQLRIIDSDGSVYAGPILDNEAQRAGMAPPAIVRNTPESEALKVEAFALHAPAREMGSLFQVAGTNLRSQQRVVFSGTLLGSTNIAATGGQLGAQAGRGFGGAVMLAQTNANVPNLRLSGTAVIGGTQQLHIEATPVSR